MKLLIERYLKQLTQHAYRGVVLLVGSDNFHLTMLNELSVFNTPDNTDVIKTKITQKGHRLPTYISSDSDIFNSNVTDKNFRFLLGSESQSFIYASKDIQPDMFAALAGTVVAGGLLVICWRTLPNDLSDIYLQRFYRQLINHELLLTIKQLTIEHNELPENILNNKSFQVSKELIVHSNIDSVISRLSESNDNHIPKERFIHTLDNDNTVVKSCSEQYAITHDQQQAINAIKKVVTGRRKRPVMITADRGRGKTTSLALACCELLQDNTRALRIIITAPRYIAVAGFFSTLQEQLNTDKAVNHLSATEPFIYHQHRIEFVPLDVILSTKPTADLLLVDEAAALPLYLLTTLFNQYHRMVFSSTLHGYEGAGRGFALKFNQFVKANKISLNTICLKQPVRWGNNDPLESLVFNTCLLNAELSPLSQLPDFCLNIKQNNHVVDSASNTLTLKSDTKKLTYQQYTADMLLNDEVLLAQIFAVLVTAHYQTSPNDLKLLLNNPSLSIFVLQYENTESVCECIEVLAVAMVISEGALEDSDNVTSASINDIEQGKRRVKNQFLPQSLLTHCGAKKAFDFTYWRIMRIAVHPQYQSKGYGQYFLACIEQSARNKRVDILGTSFGLNHSLLGYWSHANWLLTRIGFTQDQASGERSATLLKPVNISLTVKGFINDLHKQFHLHFPFYLSEQYSQLPSSLISDIFKCSNNTCNPVFLLSNDKQAIDDFISGFRLFDTCAYSLTQGLLWYLNSYNELLTSPTSISSQLVKEEPLITRLLQKKSIEKTCALYGFTGKKQLNEFFIEQFRLILSFYK